MIRALARKAVFGVQRALGGGERGLILLYHRVALEASDPYGLCVSPTHFEEHLRALQRIGTPMPVADMARAVANDALPDRAIGVTFDDAYVDVLDTAVPLLDAHDVPATVFVTVGPGGREREFWWDELERVFLGPPRLPTELELEIEGIRRAWNLGSGAELPEDRRTTGRSWHLMEREAPTRRHAVFGELYLLLRPLLEEERVRVMDRLLSWAGDPAPTIRPTRRVMSPAEVASLTGTGLVHVGAHTVSHPDLRSLPAQRRREEVEESKSSLESWTGAQVHGFAYPYGLLDDDSVSDVRAAGFGFACTGDHRAVRPGSDPLLLPRIDVPAVDGRDLEQLIRRYLG